VAMAAEEPAEAAEQGLHFFALPVSEADQLFLHAGLLDVLVAGLVDDAVFIHGHLVADLAAFFLDDGDALHDAHRAFADLGNAFGAAGVIRFRATLDLVGRPFGLIRFAHPFRTSDGAIRGGCRCRRATGVTTGRRPKICPSGGNRHGGNGANQQCETKRLAHHAFSLVIHADPVSPTETHRRVRIDN